MRNPSLTVSLAFFPILSLAFEKLHYPTGRLLCGGDEKPVYPVFYLVANPTRVAPNYGDPFPHSLRHGEHETLADGLLHNHGA